MSAPQVRFEVELVETWEGDEGVVTLKPLFCINDRACDEQRIVTYVGRKRDYEKGQRFVLVPDAGKRV